jgi:hypothetical protein
MLVTEPNADAWVRAVPVLASTRAPATKESPANRAYQKSDDRPDVQDATSTTIGKRAGAVVQTGIPSRNST